MENKEKCFADVGENECYCLSKKYCKKGIIKCILKK